MVFAQNSGKITSLRYRWVFAVFLTVLVSCQVELPAREQVLVAGAGGEWESKLLEALDAVGRSDYSTGVRILQGLISSQKGGMVRMPVSVGDLGRLRALLASPSRKQSSRRLRARPVARPLFVPASSPGRRFRGSSRLLKLTGNGGVISRPAVPPGLFSACFPGRRVESTGSSTQRLPGNFFNDTGKRETGRSWMMSAGSTRLQSRDFLPGN